MYTTVSINLNPQGNPVAPSWSPDGQFIAFTQYDCATTGCPDGQTAEDHVDLLRVADGTVTRIARGRSPAWRRP